MVAGLLLLGAAGCVAPVGDDGSWEAFRERFREGDTDAFLVEGDIVVDEAELFEYYLDTLGEDDAAVARAQGALIANDPSSVGNYDRRGGATIDYCYDDGWGRAQDGYTAPQLAMVMANVDRAARMWNGVADIHFRHRRDLDGSGCNNGLRWSGEIEFWVTHHSGPNASGAFPSAVHDAQMLKVPPGGIPTNLALHELGHILGFRHEHERGEAAPRYCDDLTSYHALTEFDPQSVMMYADCTVGSAILGTIPPSRLDGIGARRAYGNPRWWYAGAF